MELLALTAFSDNYIWMLHDGREALVVDPGDAAPVLRALDEHALRLTGILVTHHHADHVGGVDALRPRLHGPVFGPARERIPEPFFALADGARIEVLGLGFEVIDVPGHTAGHIAYFAEPEAQAPILFCGDTLFSGGCGRLFEGTAAQMHASLQRLAGLPGASRVCCAHEYTLSNLRFARAVEPDNADLAAYTVRCDALRRADQPTLPSTIAQEQRVNPFLRTDVAAVRQAAIEHGATRDATSVFATLRQWKNTFR